MGQQIVAYVRITMSQRVVRYYGSDGDVLIPLGVTEENTSRLVSINAGVVYFPQIEEIIVGEPEAGVPMGLLLSLTYA